MHQHILSVNSVRLQSNYQINHSNKLQTAIEWEGVFLLIYKSFFFCHCGYRWLFNSVLKQLFQMTGFNGSLLVGSFSLFMCQFQLYMLNSMFVKVCNEGYWVFFTYMLQHSPTSLNPFPIPLISSNNTNQLSPLYL